MNEHQLSESTRELCKVYNYNDKLIELEIDNIQLENQIEISNVRTNEAPKIEILGNKDKRRGSQHFQTRFAKFNTDSSKFKENVIPNINLSKLQTSSEMATSRSINTQNLNLSYRPMLSNRKLLKLSNKSTEKRHETTYTKTSSL